MSDSQQIFKKIIRESFPQTHAQTPEMLEKKLFFEIKQIRQIITAIIECSDSISNDDGAQTFAERKGLITQLMLHKNAILEILISRSRHKDRHTHSSNNQINQEITNTCHAMKQLLDKLSINQKLSAPHLQQRQAIQNKLNHAVDCFIHIKTLIFPVTDYMINVNYCQSIDSIKSALCESQLEVESLLMRLKKAENLYDKYFSQNSILSSTDKNHCLSTFSLGWSLNIFSRPIDSHHTHRTLTLLQKNFIDSYMKNPLELETMMEKAQQACGTSPKILKELQQLHREVKSPHPVDAPTASIASLSS